MKKIILSLLAAVCTLHLGYAQTVTRIITDFGGYWSTTTTANNSIHPNSDHNLVAFQVGSGAIYSTGVNNTILNNYGITYTPGNFKALPVIFSGNAPANTSTGPITIITGWMKDNNASTAIFTHQNVKDLSVQSVLTDGIQGLNIATGYTNLPSSTNASFSIYNVIPSKISDAEPDLIITQIGAPSTANDTFRFYDANNNIVGTAFTQNMNNVPSLGIQNVDLYNVKGSVPYSQSKPVGVYAGASTRELRLIALKLSDLGITSSNYTQIKYFRIKPSGTSDVAFVAYNGNSINVPPSIVIDSVATNYKVCATGGTAKFIISSSPASSGSLSYVWQESTDGGVTWNTVSNGGVYAGATTNALIVNATSGMIGYKYHVIVTESTTTLDNTSDEFTITSSGGTALGGTLNPNNITTCIYNPSLNPNYLSVNPSGGLGAGNYNYQWSSSTTSGGIYTDIPGAVYKDYYPNLSVAGTTYYKVNIISGCYSNLSAAGTVTVNGQDITSVTNGTICAPNNPATLSATASGTGGTFNWFYNGTQISGATSSSYTTPNLTATRTYSVSVTANGCTSAPYPVTATLTSNISLDNTNFGIPFATSPCAGDASVVSVNSSVLPNGTYTVQYSVSGNNTLTNQTSSMNFANGNGTFTTAALPTAGTNNTITITLVTLNGCNLTPSSGNTKNITVNAATPNVTGMTVTTTNSCTNKNDTVTLSGMSNLTASNTYLVTYDVSGVNTLTNQVAQVVIASGTGKFQLPLLSNQGANTITVKSLSLLSSPDCKTTINTNNTANFINSIQPIVDAGIPQSVCATAITTINIGTTASASDYASLLWSSSNGTGSFTNNTTATALSTAAYTPGSADSVNGLVYLTLTAAGNTGCYNVAKTIPFTIKNTYIWKGATSNDFGTASNWLLECVPPQGASIAFDTLPSNISKLDQDRVFDTIGNLRSTANNILDLNGKKLTLQGKLNFVTGAKIKANDLTSIMVFNGAAAQTIPASVFTDKTVSNMEINNANGVTMTDSIFITNTVRPTLGMLNTNNVLTLRSTWERTARVTEIANTSTASVSGNVIVERFIPADTNRAWRLLSSCLQPATAPTIFDSWQESVQGSSGNYQPGYGTFVSRPGAGTSNGYDSSSNSTSLQYWNGTALVTPTTTNNATTDKITDNGGAWFLFVRGDKTIRPEMYPAQGKTTLRQKGIINQGNITAGQAGTNFSMIPNPYPSPVDFDLVAANNGNITTFYIWDATLNSIGGYRTITKSGANYIATPTTSNTVTDNSYRYIQSGQAFLIPGNTQLSFTESMKTGSVPAANLYKTTSGAEQELLLTLYKTGTSNTTVDALRIWFDSSYNNSATSEDIFKMNNISENLAVGVDTSKLVIDKQQEPATTDTIQLKFWNTTLSNYQFHFEPSNLGNNLNAYLLDSYFGTLTPISLSSATDYNFTITSATGSWNIDRFKIVMTQANPLADDEVVLTGKTVKQGTSLQWNVKNTRTVKTYQLQRSDDEKDFRTINEQINSDENKKLYQWLDEEIIRNSAYYRVKSISHNAEIKYSNILEIHEDPTVATVTVYPNPVTENTFNITFDGMDEGAYNLIMYNVNGQKVMAQPLYHSGATHTYSVVLESALVNGAYTLEINKNGRVLMTKKLSVSKR